MNKFMVALDFDKEEKYRIDFLTKEEIENLKIKKIKIRILEQVR